MVAWSSRCGRQRPHGKVLALSPPRALNCAPSSSVWFHHFCPGVLRLDSCSRRAPLRLHSTFLPKGFALTVTLRPQSCSSHTARSLALLPSLVTRHQPDTHTHISLSAPLTPLTFLLQSLPAADTLHIDTLLCHLSPPLKHKLQEGRDFVVLSHCSKACLCCVLDEYRTFIMTPLS